MAVWRRQTWHRLYLSFEFLYIRKMFCFSIWYMSVWLYYSSFTWFQWKQITSHFTFTDNGNCFAQRCRWEMSAICLTSQFHRFCNVICCDVGVGMKSQQIRLEVDEIEKYKISLHKFFLIIAIHTIWIVYFKPQTAHNKFIDSFSILSHSFIKEFFHFIHTYTHISYPTVHTI